MSVHGSFCHVRSSVELGSVGRECEVSARVLVMRMVLITMHSGATTFDKISAPPVAGDA